MKGVNNRNLWNFELGSQENMSAPIWNTRGFQQRDKQDSQSLKNDNFCAIFLTYGDDDYSQCYGQIKDVFRAREKNDFLQPYISDHDFRPSTDRNEDIGYKIYVFDMSYQQNFTGSQPIKEEFKTDGVVANDINGYASVLTNELVSVSSDGQPHFDLI